MRKMSYMLGSGYFPKEGSLDFSEIWASTIVRNIKNKPESMVILSNGKGGVPPVSSIFLANDWPAPQFILAEENMGHIGQLLNGQVDNKFCGWSSSVLALAMIAYNSGLHYLFIEQDVIIKGDVLEQLLIDLGDAKFIFGKAHFMPAAQSIFYIRHDFIPKLVSSYIACGSDAHDYNLPESKFCQIEQMLPEDCRRLSYPYDREKPIDWDLPVLYAQHLTSEEMEEAKRRGIV